MTKYRKKPVVIEATQWFKDGDHPKVISFKNSPKLKKKLCSGCGQSLILHGDIMTLEGVHIVCPGDWIITGVKNENYPCKPAIFVQTYEKVN